MQAIFQDNIQLCNEISEKVTCVIDILADSHQGKGVWGVDLVLEVHKGGGPWYCDVAVGVVRF